MSLSNTQTAVTFSRPFGIIYLFVYLIFQEEKPSYPPRLFQCSNASGAFKVEEIFDFSQEVEKIILSISAYL